MKNPQLTYFELIMTNEYKPFQGFNPPNKKELEKFLKHNKRKKKTKKIKEK